MNDPKNRLAPKVLADFLKQPENEISCMELTGGSEEGSIFKCTYQSAVYVIKFFTNKEAGKNEIAWTKHASELGIGPKFFCAASDNSYMITAFATGDSLVPETANASTILKGIAINLAKLHHSSATFAHVSDIFTRIDAKYKKLQCSGPLKDMLANGMQQVKTIEVQLKKISVTPEPCHNDLNWGNIFVDENNHVTLIDWGDAALGNPFYDIAAFFVLNCIEAENEKLFFELYDAELLNPEWKGYMQLLKQLVYFEFALNLLLGVQTSKNELLHAQELPKVNRVSDYLTLLANKEVKVDSEFLYRMAIASLAML